MLPKQLPLEPDWVERLLVIVVEGQTVTGIAANWGAIEVSITAPIAYLTRKYDAQGWAFAMLASLIGSIAREVELLGQTPSERRRPLPV